MGAGIEQLRFALFAGRGGWRATLRETLASIRSRANLVPIYSGTSPTSVA